MKRNSCKTIDIKSRHIDVLHFLLFSAKTFFNPVVGVLNVYWVKNMLTLAYGYIICTIYNFLLKNTGNRQFAYYGLRDRSHIAHL